MKLSASTTHEAPQLEIYTSLGTPRIQKIQAPNIYHYGTNHWTYRSDRVLLPNALPSRYCMPNNEQAKHWVEKSEKRLAVIAAIRKKIAAEICPLAKLKVCANPLSGGDGSIVALLPQTSLYIGIDAQPFLPTTISASDRFSYSPAAVPSYLDVTSAIAIGKEKTTSMASLLLGTMAFSESNFRLRKMTAFTSYENTDGLDLSLMQYKIGGLSSPLVPDNFTKRVHGLIEFDRGEGTSIQQYLHINDILEDSGNFLHSWWIQALRYELAPQAVLVKSALGVFSSNSGATSYLAQEFFLDLMRRHYSVLIEGSLEDTPYELRYQGSGEFSGREILGAPSTRVNTDGTYGYGNSVIITHLSS